LLLYPLGTEITKRAISETTNVKTIDLKAVAPRMIGAKKAWMIKNRF